MGLILDISPRTLEKVLYFANYIYWIRLIPDSSTNRYLQRENIRMHVRLMGMISV